MSHVHKLSCLDKNSRCPDASAASSAGSAISSTHPSPKTSKRSPRARAKAIATTTQQPFALPAGTQVDYATVMRKLKNRIDDPDASFDSYLARHRYAADLSDAEIPAAIAELNSLKASAVEAVHSAKSPYVEREANLTLWRANTAIDGFRSELEHRHKTAEKRRAEAAVEEAIKTGKETCQCGQGHTKGSNYYVSVKDAGKTSLLRGPYRTHAEAIAAVPKTKEDAIRIDARAHFYSFGTVAMKKGYTKPGVLGAP